MGVIAKISSYFERSVVTLKLRKEYLNTVTYNTPILLRIKYWTVRYIEHYPMSTTAHMVSVWSYGERRTWNCRPTVLLTTQCNKRQAGVGRWQQYPREEQHIVSVLTTRNLHLDVPTTDLLHDVSLSIAVTSHRVHVHKAAECWL